MKVMLIIVKTKGLRIFEICEQTLEINEAMYRMSANLDVIKQKVVKRGKLITKPNHVYVQAINKKNALRKYRKSLSTKS